jgi:hypothetical protein
MRRVIKRHYRLTQSTLLLREGQVVAQNLPPALAETLPNLPEIKESRPMAVLCSNFACQPPMRSAQELERALTQ